MQVFSNKFRRRHNTVRVWWCSKFFNQKLYSAIVYKSFYITSVCLAVVVIWCVEFSIKVSRRPIYAGPSDTLQFQSLAVFSKSCFICTCLYQRYSAMHFITAQNTLYYIALTNILFFTYTIHSYTGSELFYASPSKKYQIENR